MERFKLPLVGFNFAFVLYMLIFGMGLFFGRAPDTIGAVMIQAAIAAAVGLVVGGIVYGLVAFAGK